MIRESMFGWKRFLDYFQRLTREGVAKGTRAKWKKRIVALDAQIAPLRAERDELVKKLKDTCSHPVDVQKVSSTGREDDYGSWTSGSDYVIACLECGQRLAEFSSEQENETVWDESIKGRRKAREFPWEDTK
jgi:hypothetical protein